MYQKRYKEPGEKWEEVGQEQVDSALTGYYKRVQFVLKEMTDFPGRVYHTPYAMFRWINPKRGRGKKQRVKSR